jgi:Tfp pilus assembly PilM family ATPase
MKLNSYKPERLCSVGIDFGTRSTKIVSLSKYGARIDINSAGSIATLAGGISAGEIDDPKVFSKSLKQFVQHHKIDDYCTTFDIPSNCRKLQNLRSNAIYHFLLIPHTLRQPLLTLVKMS